MKKVFTTNIILFLIALSTFLNAQIVNDNSSWNMLSLYTKNGLVHIPQHTTKIYFDGDSLLNSKTYKKVFHCFDDEFCLNPIFYGLIREENQKTYFVFSDETKEYLLYDFSVELGDIIKFDIPGVPMEVEEEFRTFSRQVHSIDYININGVLKKRIKLAYLNSESIVNIWIENLGSLSNFYTIDTRVGYSYALSCYFQDNELVYKNPNYSECYYNNPADIPSVQTVVLDDCYIYSNLVDDILTISSSNNIISQIEIFDISGKKVYSHTYKESIDMSSFSKGLYLLKMYDTNGQISLFKIIRK